MATDRWRAVEALFDAALDLEAEAREALLVERAATDADLVAEVRALLSAVTASEGFLETPAVIPQAPSLEGRTLGDFEVLRLLGRGGMGAVYLAEQRSPQRHAALKVMTAVGASAARRRRFEVESELLARLEHPGIASVYASGIEAIEGRETPWFAMELVDGGRDVLAFARDGGLDARARVELFIHIAGAVRYAHGRGVLHRDLKPSNLLVDRDGRPKVIDFGIGREFDDDTTASARTALTQEGELLGTLAYMAPEQVADGDTDARTDVHGLGVVLYELMCGRPPRDLGGRSMLDAARVLATMPAARPTPQALAAGADLEWILARALANDPDERYPTVEALESDLVALLDGRPVSAGPPTALYRARRFVGRHRLGVSIAATVALALVASTVVSLEARRRALDSEARTKLEQLATAEALALAEQRRVEAERAAVLAVDARDFLEQLIVAPSPYRDGIHVRLVDLLDDRGRAIEAALSDDPELELVQRASLAVAYRGLGLYDRVLRHAERALAIFAEHGGPADIRDSLAAESIRALTSLSRFEEADALALDRLARARGTSFEESALMDRADLLISAGRVDEAELILRELVGRPELRLRGAARLALGGLLLERGLRDEAEPEFEAAIAAMAADEPGDGAVVIAADNGLALIALERGELDEAVARLTELRVRATEVFGPVHPRTTTVTANLAAALREAGEPEAALALHEEAVAAALERLGPRSQTYLTARSNLAGTLRELGRLEEAAEITVATFAVQREVLGDAHPDTLGGASNVARLYELLGRPSESVGAFELARDLAVAQLGARHERSVSLGSELAKAHLGLGEFSRALAVLEPLAPIAAETLPAGNGVAWRVPNNLGGAYRKLGRFAEAEAAYREALIRTGDDPPESGEAGLFVLGNLAETLRLAGEQADALELFERTVAATLELHGEFAPPTLMAESKLAWALYTGGDYAGAAEDYASILERTTKYYPPGHWTPAVWRGNRGAALEQLGRLEEARAELEQSATELTAALGAESPRTTSVQAVLDRVVAELADRVTSGGASDGG